ncbi:hypothetical protein M8J76_011058 [Diaphorina citri]|nr:hypothetical protein M8J76_011058 [Diaphorina citri]
MFIHASSSAYKWPSLLITFAVIVQTIANAPPKPQPKPRIEEEPQTSVRPAHRIHPHRLTIPPLPSGSVDSYDSDQHKYNLTASGEYRNKYGVNRYGVQREGTYKLGLQYWADDEVMLMFPRYPPLRSFEKHYGRYGGLNARKLWAHWNIPEDRSANGYHSGINSENFLGGRPPPLNSKDFEYRPGRYPKRYYFGTENPKCAKKERVKRALAKLKKVVKQDDQYDWKMVSPYDMGGRPPPGKTERRKRKTQEMAQTVVIRNKRRAVTPQMKRVDERKEKMNRVRRDLDSTGNEEKLRKRNKVGDNKRSAFRSWMSKIVPEHASHIEKLHDKGLDKLMGQKVHGMEKTYADLFHEHLHGEKKLHPGEHEPHHLEMHREGHEPHHLDPHAEHEAHHFDSHGKHEAHHFEPHAEHEAHHYEPHGEHEAHHYERHGEHEAHHYEMGEEHDPHHIEAHLEKEKSHHAKEAALEEEYKKKAHKKLLEELYLKDGKKHETKDEHEHELEEKEHAEQPAQAQAQPNANYPQQTQQNYPQQNYNQNYPQSPAAGPDPNIQNAQDAAAAQQKAAQDQEAQVPQPDTQDSTQAIQDKDQDASADSSINAKAGDASDDAASAIKADHSNDGGQPDDLNLPSEDTINAQDNNNALPDNEQNAQFDNIPQNQNPQFYNPQQYGQFPLDNGQNSNLAAAAAAG